MEDLRNQLDYQNKKLIGISSLGIVYKILNKKNNKYYILKRILLKKIDDIEKSKNEANILKNINHENIVKYYDSFEKNNSFYIIMEYCDNSDLWDFIKKYKKDGKLIHESIIYIIVLDICKGLKEIHSKNLIHRDLKPENLFISKDYKIKIGDFGISKILINTIHARTEYVGTGYYMAPEIYKNEEYTNKIDIWSLGCIIYELFTLNKCFETENLIGLGNEIINVEHKKIENKEWQNIIDKLLNKNSKNRPDINEVIELIIKMNNKNYIIEEKYLNNLDEISKNVIRRKDNYIIGELNIKEDNKNIRIINSYEESRKENLLDLGKEYENEKEIKDNCEIRINDEIIPFSYYYKFKIKGKYKIEYRFKNKIIKNDFMFADCSSLTNLNLSNFNTQNVTDMNHMFSDCSSLTNINLSNFNTQNVTDMNHMFSNCSSITNINLSNFNTQNVTDMSYMFDNCYNLNKQNIITTDNKIKDLFKDSEKSFCILF